MDDAVTSNRCVKREAIDDGESTRDQPAEKIVKDEPVDEWTSEQSQQKTVKMEAEDNSYDEQPATKTVKVEAEPTPSPPFPAVEVKQEVVESEESVPAQVNPSLEDGVARKRKSAFMRECELASEYAARNTQQQSTRSMVEETAEVAIPSLEEDTRDVINIFQPYRIGTPETIPFESALDKLTKLLADLRSSGIPFISSGIWHARSGAAFECVLCTKIFNWSRVGEHLFSRKHKKKASGFAVSLPAFHFWLPIPVPENRGSGEAPPPPPPLYAYDLPRMRQGRVEPQMAADPIRADVKELLREIVVEVALAADVHAVGTDACEEKFIFMDERYVGGVMGRGQRNIRTIEKETRTFINLISYGPNELHGNSDAMRAYWDNDEELPSAKDQRTLFLRVRAPTKDQIVLAKIAIDTLITDAKRRKHKDELKIPAESIEYVRGQPHERPRGIQKLCSQFRVRCKVPKKNGEYATIHLEGTPEDIEAAKTSILEMVDTARTHYEKALSVSVDEALKTRK